VIICNSHKFIYLHLHKCGGTSVELALEPAMQWSDLMLGSTRTGEAINDYYAVRFGLNKHSSLADVERVCGPALLDACHLFTTVRHPVDRACSLYNYLAGIEGQIRQRFGVTREGLQQQYQELRAKEPILEWFAMQAFVRSADFSSFIRDRRLADDPGFQLQVNSLRTPSGKWAVEVFRLEDELGDLERMLSERTGMDIRVPRANASSSKVVQPRDIPSSDAAFLHERFHEDFRLFGYDD
jgi:hypothetical protein